MSYTNRCLNLTRARLGGRGGGYQDPLAFFQYLPNEDINKKLSVPFGASLLHVIRERKFRTYNRLAGNDVRVASCPDDFDAK